MRPLRRVWDLLSPYALASAVTVAAAVVIAFLNTLYRPRGWLSVFILAALWIGSRWGTGPAVLASILMTSIYDYFFESPVNSFLIGGWESALYMAFLLAAGITGGRVGALMTEARRKARAVTNEVNAVYEIATEALRAGSRNDALKLLCERALAIRCIRSFSIVVVAPGGAEATSVFGRPLAPSAVEDALQAHRRGTAVGVRADRDGFRVVQVVSRGQAALLPFGNAVAVFEVSDGVAASDVELRALGAMTALAATILDRPSVDTPTVLQVIKPRAADQLVQSATEARSTDARDSG